jgi:hypothetical protein
MLMSDSIARDASMGAALLARAGRGMRPICVGAAANPSFRCCDDVLVVVCGLIVENVWLSFAGRLMLCTARLRSSGYGTCTSFI